MPDIAQPVLEVSKKERRGAMQESAGRATWSLTVLSPAFRDKMSQDRRKRSGKNSGNLDSTYSSPG